MTFELNEEWTPSQEEYNAFATVSGDDNPIHVDPAFSAKTRFGRTVAHGMYIYSRLWRMIKQAQPEATNVAQTLMFPAPCFTGEVVLLSVRQTSDQQFEIRAVRQYDGQELLVGTTKVA